MTTRGHSFQLRSKGHGQINVMWRPLTAVTNKHSPDGAAVNIYIYLRSKGQMSRSV